MPHLAVKNKFDGIILTQKMKKADKSQPFRRIKYQVLRYS